MKKPTSDLGTQHALAMYDEQLRAAEDLLMKAVSDCPGSSLVGLLLALQVQQGERILALLDSVDSRLMSVELEIDRRRHE